MNTQKIYKNIADELFDTFYVDDHKYGRQLNDGSYRLVREKITTVTIEDMLKENKSLLTYQELHTLNNAHIKWICLDLDISKKEIDKNTINVANLKLVKKSADDICEFLKSVKIPYLLEFSGRRGFHIWIVFEELISKEEGFYLISYILSQVKLQENIIADKFPATAFVGINSKGVGKGVKLPLSQNKSSEKLSFFIDENNEFDFEQENWLSIPNDDFLAHQYDILKNKQTISKQFLKNILENSDTNIFLNYSEKYLKLKQVKHFYLPFDTSLEEILASLKKCEHLAVILKDYQKGLGGKERIILSGLLGKLKTENDPIFGKNILLELFSNIKGFNEEITIKKLSNIEYLSPITCNFWDNCTKCEKLGITSPVELINGVVLEDRPLFAISNIDNKLFSTLIKASKKYSLSNDEVPLYPLLKKIEHANEKEIRDLIDEILNGKIVLNKESFRFERIEGKKTRILYNLEYKNNLVSTYFIFILNNLFYSEISNYSFGYEFSPSFYNDNIFTNWFANWGKFSKNTEHVIFNEEYDNYYLIKIDIKGFYDNINIQRLSINLYEEAPKSIKSKLNELAPDELFKYKNIIKYLTLLTKETTDNNEKGVPQGPAYARYLAELYLIGLDKTIEDYIGIFKGREFYNRFVDDAYIFLETEERAIELYDKIEKWLNINNLELNKIKSEICNVKEYREFEKFKRYSNDVKYTINKANKNKNILSDKEINDTLKLLENLTNDVKFGLKDNIRFFYFQFKNDNRLKHIRQKLARILPFSEDGRGTLYLIFYNDLLNTSPEIFIELIEQIDKLKGLSFTHYLNTILLEWDKIKNTQIDLNNLIEKATLKAHLSNADKLLIITIAMKENISLSVEFKNECPSEIITSAFETPEIKYCSGNYDLLETKLEDINDRKLFLEELFRIINQNELDISVANKLANYAFTRFSIWSSPTEDTLFLNDENNIVLYYHSLCYFTLFHKAKDHKDVTASWVLLLEKSEEVTIGAKIEFIWIKQLENFTISDFSRNSYSILLANKQGSPFTSFICKNDFLDKYRNILLYLLYSRRENLESFLEKITEYTHDSLFYSWLQNKDVSLYPESHKVSMQNLAVNGLIVLENRTENKIFIKSINNEINHTQFDFIRPSSIENCEFEYQKEQFTILDDKLDKSHFVPFLNSLSKKIKKHQEFKEKYNVNYPVFYNPVFFNNGRPLVPFYSVYPNLVSSNGIVKTNDIDSYWENLLEVIKSSDYTDIRITSDDNPFNYSLKDIEEKFFPSSELVIINSQDKINFIIEFVESTKDVFIENIYDFQYYWSLTVLGIIKCKEQNPKNILLKYLNVHFDHIKDGQDVSDILFAVDVNIDNNETTLWDFFNSIKNSFTSFQSQLTNPTSEISDVFINYLAIIKDSFVSEKNVDTLKENFLLKDFILTNVSINKKFNPLSGINEDVILINNESVKIENTYYFDHNFNSFQALSADNPILVNDKPFSYVKIKEERYYIYIPENELIKSLNRIKERKRIYDELDSNGEYIAKYKLLFPKNESFIRAEKLYLQSNTTELENNLKNHYTETSNIKERIISWLSLFNEKSIEGSDLKTYMDKEGYSIETLYSALIEIIKAHISIKIEDIRFFKEKIIEYNNSVNHLLFPLKQPYQDGNGLERLFEKCGLLKRDIDVDKDFRKLVSHSFTSQTIVVISDISISGTQAGKAIDFYLASYESDEELKAKRIALEAKNEKYFPVNDQKELAQLQYNFKNSKEIIFVSPVMTEEYKKNITSKINDFDVTADLNFESSILLKEEEYLLGKKRLDRNNKKLFYVLISDIILLKKIFNCDNWSKYKNNIDDFALPKLNTLLRIGSLPSLHIQLFSLRPKNGVKSLLDYIDNWKR